MRRGRILPVSVTKRDRMCVSVKVRLRGVRVWRFSGCASVLLIREKRGMKEFFWLKARSFFVFFK